MKNQLTLLLWMLLCSLTAKAQNPIIQTRYTSDPAPMVYHDTLFLYVGCDEPGAPKGTYLMREYRLYTTTDMVNWTDCGALLKTSQFNWSAGDASAAQVIERNGKFYWYISSQNSVSPGSSIGVAVADSPYGPFHDALDAGLVTNNMTTQAPHSWDDLDPTVWIDANQQAYLYWGNGICYYAPLNQDMVSLAGPIKAINAKDSVSLGGNFTEAPWLYKRGNTYYLVYAAGFPEWISYATAKSIDGPWTYRGKVMPTQKGSNTNHPGLIDYKGQSFFFYHNDALPGGHGYARSVCVEPFSYTSDGAIPEIQMTEQGIPVSLGKLNPYNKVQAETIAWSEGVTTVQEPDGRIYVSDIHHGDYIKVRGVDFGTNGARSFSAAVASRYFGGNIELHLDGIKGPLVGTLTVPYTGEWDHWQQISTTVDGAQGVHDLYLVFTGRQPQLLFNFDYWYFDTQETLITRAVQQMLETHPASRLQDIYKSCFQDVYGPGHLIEDTTSALSYLDWELEQTDYADTVLCEPTGINSHFYRVNLSLVKEGALAKDALLQAFVKSANTVEAMPVAQWATQWRQIVKVISQMPLQLPNFAEDSQMIEELLQKGEYVMHHSDAYSEAYAPHYRIVSARLINNLKNRVK